MLKWLVYRGEILLLRPRQYSHRHVRLTLLQRPHDHPHSKSVNHLLVRDFDCLPLGAMSAAPRDHRPLAPDASGSLEKMALVDEKEIKDSAEVNVYAVEVQIALESDHEIQYRTCSWQKVSEYAASSNTTLMLAPDRGFAIL